MEPKLRSFIISLLRSGTRRWPPANAAFNKAKRTFYIDSKHGKKLKRVEFQCAICKKWFKRDHVQRDHILPIIPVTGFDSWENVFLRLFCQIEGFQILCKPDHKLKTLSENLERKKYRNI